MCDMSDFLHQSCIYTYSIQNSIKNVHIVNMKILYIHIIMKIVIFYKNNLNIYYL